MEIHSSAKRIGSSLQHVFVLSVLTLALGFVAAGCSSDSGLDGSKCSPDGKVSEDGTRRCENGYWVSIDGGTADASPDAGEDAGPDGGRDAGPDAGRDAGPDAGCDVPESWYRDEDGDGFGTSDQVKMACSKPDGYADNDEDCDDDDASTNPDASESCDGKDNDCDGMIDEGQGCDCAYDPTEPDHIDTDGDYQNGVCTGQTVDDQGVCGEPGEFTARTDDEKAEGLCDGLDNDCDGDVDEGCGCTYDPNESDSIDTDKSHNSGVCVAQGFDNSGACEEPSDFETRTDAEGSCDGKDNDCDSNTDEGCSCTYDPGETDDADTDASHDAGVCPGQSRDASGVCQTPGDFEMRTDNESSCDGVDNDCDGTVDEGCSCIYDPDENDDIDTDDSNNSGVCTNQSVDTSGVCTKPAGFESPTDTEANCNRTDNDCDGAVDEGCSCTYDADDTNNADSDGDNQNGVCINQTRDTSGTCQEPSDYDGTDDESSVGSGSLCDGKDNDCDGATDEGCACTFDPTQFDDVDTDGSHGAGLCLGQSRDSSGSCREPTDFESQMPGETKCDNKDNDCDGNTDENITVDCYSGKSGTAGTGICQKGSETCSNGSFGDCQGETIQTSDPSTAEVDCSNSKDDDCDGSSDSNDCFFRDTISGNPAAGVADIAVDSSTGDVYVVGTAGDIRFGGTTDEAFLIKYDSSGTRQWKETLASTDIAARGIALDTSNSRVYIAGEAENSVAGSSVSGSSDGFIAKYDFSGNRQLVVTVGSSSRDELDDIAFDPDDTAVVVGGLTEGDFSSSTSNLGNSDAVVAEYDTTLVEQWVAQFGGSSSEVVETLDVDESNGDVYAAGDTLGAIASGETNQGSGDIYVARFDSGGTRQWIDQSGSSDDDDVEGITVEDGNAAYVVGETEGDLLSISHAGDDDAFASKWTQGGSLAWVDSVGTSSHDDFHSPRYDPDSQTLFVVGTTWGTPDSTGNAGEADVTVASYTSGGTRNWIETRGTAQYDGGFGVGSSTGSSALYIGGVWDMDLSAGDGKGFVSRIR